MPTKRISLCLYADCILNIGKHSEDFILSRCSSPRLASICTLYFGIETRNLTPIRVSASRQRVKGVRIMTKDGNCQKSEKPNSRKSMKKKGIAFISGCGNDDYLNDTN